ncbi:MAG TPA: ABC transporter substrate-binding protein [Candidatus Limnocylindria bacterium]|jgi:NitT/TauT family transport system substrate-binding protein|nr:ABC transporter substrate-binding protein [Candidatus Limnocylindria bacterium]
MRVTRVFGVLVVAASLFLAACQSSASESPAESAAGSAGASAEPSQVTYEPASVSLQLQWTDQAQFAGYYAAVEQGYYDDVALTVEILPGGGTIVPQQVGSAPDGPEFTIAWMPKVLEAREAGSDLVHLAQVFQRSATLSVAWADAGITEVTDWAGKRIGAWPFGNELEVLATAEILGGLTDGEDFTRVEQDFDMNELIAAQDGCAASDSDCVDVAEAMIYNEWAQLLETTDPNTGELFQPDQFEVFDFNELGTAMLQDGLYARQSWLDEGNNTEVAMRFLQASFRGWMYCRDNPDDCVQYSIDRGSIWEAGHLAWMMNEINKLVWPAEAGIGHLDEGELTQTVDTASAAGILTGPPDDAAFNSAIWEEALSGIDGDTTGDDFAAPEVPITPGGE